MAPGMTGPARSRCAASHHLLLAHGLGVAALRESAPEPPSDRPGRQPQPDASRPAQCRPTCRASQSADGHINRWWLDPLFGRGYPGRHDRGVRRGARPSPPGDAEIIAAPTDFVGLNYYFRQIIKADESVPALRLQPRSEGPNAARTMLDWEVHPAGLERAASSGWRSEYGAEPDLHHRERHRPGSTVADAAFNVRRHRPNRLSGRRIWPPASARSEQGAAAGRLLRVVAAGQLRVGLRLRTPVRPGIRRLSDRDPCDEDQRQDLCRPRQVTPHRIEQLRALPQASL